MGWASTSTAKLRRSEITQSSATLGPFATWIKGSSKTSPKRASFWSRSSFTWNAGGQIVLADGKTRLTGIGRYLHTHKELLGKLTVPFNRVKGTDNEIRLQMLHYGLKESRIPLTDADVSKYLRSLDKKGITEDEQLRVLDKAGRRGKIWLNHMKSVLDANPAVVQAFEEGEVDFTTAKMLAKDKWEEQPSKLKAFKKLKRDNPDKSEAELRKLSGVKAPNNVTLGFDATIAYIIDTIYFAFDKARAREEQRPEWGISLDWASEQDRAEYINTQAVKREFELACYFLRIGDRSESEKRRFIEGHMTDEQMAALTTQREETERALVGSERIYFFAG